LAERAKHTAESVASTFDTERMFNAWLVNMLKQTRRAHPDD